MNLMTFDSTQQAPTISSNGQPTYSLLEAQFRAKQLTLDLVLPSTNYPSTFGKLLTTNAKIDQAEK
jgi:hypothetical protein